MKRAQNNILDVNSHLTKSSNIESYDKVEFNEATITLSFTKDSFIILGNDVKQRVQINESWNFRFSVFRDILVFPELAQNLTLSKPNEGSRQNKRPLANIIIILAPHRSNLLIRHKLAGCLAKSQSSSPLKA